MAFFIVVMCCSHLVVMPKGLASLVLSYSRLAISVGASAVAAANGLQSSLASCDPPLTSFRTKTRNPGLAYMFATPDNLDNFPSSACKQTVKMTGCVRGVKNSTDTLIPASSEFLEVDFAGSRDPSQSSTDHPVLKCPHFWSEFGDAHLLQETIERTHRTTKYFTPERELPRYSTTTSMSKVSVEAK
jgi:hypothetical protein